MNGWIKIYRKMTEWKWYKNYVVKDVFLHLLLLANHDEKIYKGIHIQRGQIVTSYRKLAAELGFSTQQIRTALATLKSTHEITYISTHQYSLVTIEKYSDYQDTFFETNTISNTRNNTRTNNKQEE